MPPVSHVPSTSTSTTAPIATDSREEEMPNKDENQVKEQLKTPKQTITILPPSAPKKPAPALTPPAPVTSATHKARDVQAAKANCATPKNKMKANKSPDEDSNYQWPDDGVFRGVHPDHKGSPTAVLLANDEEEFIFHIGHDALIASATQDNDPKLLAKALS